MTSLLDLDFRWDFRCILTQSKTSKYLLKSKSEVISLSENMATNTDSLVN